MKRSRRIIAAILAAVLTYGVFFSTATPSFAAVTAVSIIVDKYSSGTLDFHWSQLPGVKAAVITYHKPDSTNPDFEEEVILKQTTNTGKLTGLKSDIIYDIKIELYDTVDVNGDPTGLSIGKGLLYYIPKISFYSETPSQTYDEISGGGRESGKNPRLKLKWKIPSIWSSANLQFELANSEAIRLQMQTELRAVYGDARVLSRLNFRINISTNPDNLNSGTSAVIINQDGSGKYTANMINETNYATVTNPDPNDYVSFEIWGRSGVDGTVLVPSPANANVLPDNALFPGSVYFMNIKPIYTVTPQEVSGLSTVTVGSPDDKNGSMLSGPVSYAYTPIRFQLTKDSLNNIYVKIYRINQGSLNLPSLFYEVQASDDPAIQGDWEFKAKMVDSNFSGGYAITVIRGVNPNTDVYYKIVVKSESPNDRLESLKLPYTLLTDTGRPPLPTNIIITNKVLHAGDVTTPAPDNQTINVKSTDVTISWDKPLGWDDSTYKKADLSYHFLLSTSQTDMDTPVYLFADGTKQVYGKTENVHAPLGQFKPMFRLVKYINANNADIKPEGNRLTLTLDAFDLFTWEKADDTSDEIPNNEDGHPYPDFLLPNTVYYLQMYTTTADGAGTENTNEMSDKSIITSFTTLNGVELDVPLPMSFALDANGKDSDSDPAVNYVDLRFDKVMNLDWTKYTNKYDTTLYNYNIYYDIFMGLRSDTNSFVQIGSTQNPDGDLEFSGVDDPTSTFIKARVSKFKDMDPDSDAEKNFGYKLLPNTTYYFKANTRLVITPKDSSPVITRKSIDTAILPVTTIVININPPDDNMRKPLAPTDFTIAEDIDGNQLLSGSSVTFTWQRQENDVVYQLIKTKLKVNPSDLKGAYEDDPEYTSFLPAYDESSDGFENELIYLDPTLPPTQDIIDGKFEYVSATKTCTYTIDRRMFPNKLYYFSLKAVRAVRTPAGYTPGAESVWVSIPVTTSLIEPPSQLEAVNNAELGFFWTDNTSGMTAEDYTIYAKSADDIDYKMLTRSQSTIVRDVDGRTYYGRLLGLKINTPYDIRVFRGSVSSGTLVYEKLGMQTRDANHEIEVKWIGTPVDAGYSSYEIALMAEGSSEYTILTGNDLEYYSDKDGKLLPYYTEETPLTVNNKDSLCFHARIKQNQVALAGGLVTHQPLRSNVKYYIKVRAAKEDPADGAMISYSKYAGPVNTRTEFNQDDYDNTDQEEKQEAIFLDRMKQLEQGYYWRIAINSGIADRILLKGDRVVNAMQSLPESTFTVDLTAININLDKDEVYIPVSVVKTMNTLNKNLLIKAPGAEFLLRPETFDAAENKQLKELLAQPAVKDLYLRLMVARTDTAPSGLSLTGERISRINDLEIQAVGSSKTDSELKKLFYDKLYNKDNGLVSIKLNILQNTYLGKGADASRLMDEYTEKLVQSIESELSAYIDSTIEAVRLPSATQNIIDFTTPVSTSLSFNEKQGTKAPYVLYDGTAAWQKITNNTQQVGKISLNILKTGKYTVVLVQGAVKDVPDSHWAKESISKLTSKYDLSDVFSGMGTTFMPDNKVTGKELILLYEKVAGRSSANAGLDIRQKSAKLELDSILNPNGILKNVRRQETAAVLLKLFAVKKGVNADSLRPGGNIYINDEANIDELYYNSVVMIVDINVMTLNNDGNFVPSGNMTRAEVSVAIVKLLELTGDI